MTGEQRKTLAAFMRTHIRLIADLSCLYSILDAFEHGRKPPMNWKQMWHEMQESKDYAAQLQEYEPLIQSLEQSAAESRLIEILQKISKGMPIN